MSLTPLGPAPSRTDSANFNTRADALLGALPNLVAEINAELPVIAVAAANGTAAALAATNAAVSAAAAATSAALAANVAAGSAGDLPDVAPVLLCDFMRSKSLDPRFTFTRASTATFIDDRGIVRTAAANTPRFTHDPITGRCLGLLLEPARTNQLSRSGEFGATWLKAAGGTGTAPVVTDNFGVAPDGTTTASRAVFASGAGTTTADFSSIVPAPWAPSVIGQPIVASIWLRSNTTLSYVLALDFNSTVSDAAGFPSLITVTPTWRRFEIRLASPVDVNRCMGLRIRGAGGTSSTADIQMWGAQQETGSGVTWASSLIPTAGAAATRAADVCSLGTAPFATMHNPLEGSLVAHLSWPTLVGFAEGGGVTLSDGTLSDSIRLTRGGTGAVPKLFFTDDAVITADVGSASQASANVRVGQAGAWRSGDQSLAVNGTLAPNAGSTVALPVVDRLFIGGRTGQQDGTIIERLMWFNRRLPDPVLAALSRT
jgi:hypothetical protein